MLNKFKNNFNTKDINNYVINSNKNMSDEFARSANILLDKLKPTKMKVRIKFWYKGTLHTKRHEGTFDTEKEVRPGQFKHNRTGGSL